MASSPRALIEVFGHAPNDNTPAARKFWSLSACPFIGKACSKFDHTSTICYGTCSVTNAGQNVVICPNRMYEENYKTIRKVSHDAFGNLPFYLFDDYLKLAIKEKTENIDVVVALGQKSGKEVKISQMSMDWVLAHIKGDVLCGYVGIEVQSIDITGNYRDAWYAAKNSANQIPQSAHGLNWANVHKRLIPQIIRKSLIYSKSNLVTKGLYFVVPEPVYQRFEDIIGKDIPVVEEPGKDVITVHTYDLGPEVPFGSIRSLLERRKLRFKLDDFSARFITGPNLPSGDVLDNKIREILCCK
jgi:Restriction endonuclease NotI